MEGTQSVRLTETMDTAEITLNHVGGQNIVYWEDIEQVFPGVKRVRNGKSVIKFHRGSNQQSINCCPHSVLDVVMSTSVEPIGVNPSKLDLIDGQTDRTDAPADAPVEDKVIDAAGITPPTPETSVSDISLFDTSSPSSDVNAFSKVTLFQQIATRASRKAQESEIEQRFISLLAPEVQETVRASSNIYEAFAKAVKDGHGELSRVELSQVLSGHFQELKAMLAKNTELQEAMNARQEEVKQLQEQVLGNQKEMKQLQQRALDQLAVLQSRIQAVLMQNYELHEYPIPRLFIVLPVERDLWDRLNPFTHRFRLYFLCECGEHTKTVSSAISHQIHLAKHIGYDLQQPTKFFDKYGPYLLTMLQMVKFGIAVAGAIVPTLTHLKLLDGIDVAKSGLTFTKETFAPMLDESISYVSSHLGQDGAKIDATSGEELANQEALEGADLRQLATFLAGTDQGKALGNLYRIATDQGHVKWVCFDHYRENYMDSLKQRLSEIVTQNSGHLDEHEGKIMIKLRTPVTARLFYDALCATKGIHELNIGLTWDVTKADLKQLCNAILGTNISVLTIDGNSFKNPTLDAINRGSRFDPILQLMASGKLQSFTISDCPKFLDRITGLGLRSCPTLRHLWLNYDISNSQSKDFPNSLSLLVTCFSNLSELCIGCRDVDEPFTLLQKSRLDLLHLKTLVFKEGRSDNKGRVMFAIKNGKIESSEVVLEDSLPENLLQSGSIRHLTLLRGTMRQLQILKRIVDNNSRLGTIILPSPEDLIQQIQHFDYMASNRLQPLCIIFTQDDTPAIEIEFRGQDGRFSGIPFGDCIQGIKSTIYVKWLSLVRAWTIDNDVAVMYLVGLLEHQAHGRVHFARFTVGIERMTDLGVQATLRAFALLIPVAVNLRCEDVNRALLTTFCSGLDAQFGSRLSSLKFCGRSVDAWIQCLEHLTRNSMPVLREINFYDGRISYSSALWIASMMAPTGATVESLVKISFLRTDICSDSWSRVLDAIDFTTLQVLEISECGFHRQHLDQLVDRLPENASLTSLVMEYQDWRFGQKGQQQALEAKMRSKARSLCNINLGIIPPRDSRDSRVYRLTVLGDGGAGKTELVIQFCMNHFNGTYDPTTEDSYTKYVVIDEEPCVLYVMDTSGQENFSAMVDLCIRGSDGFVLVYSIAARSTFESVQQWHDKILHIKSKDDVPIILVGNECNKLTEREVSRDEGALMAKTLRCGFTEADARTGVNVERSFYNLVRMIRQSLEGGARKAN